MANIIIQPNAPQRLIDQANKTAEFVSKNFGVEEIVVTEHYVKYVGLMKSAVTYLYDKYGIEGFTSKR